MGPRNMTGVRTVPSHVVATCVLGDIEMKYDLKSRSLVTLATLEVLSSHGSRYKGHVYHLETSIERHWTSGNSSYVLLFFNSSFYG